MNMKNNMSIKNGVGITHDITLISRMGKMLKLLHILETTLTVGIIAFTVLRVINIFREQN